MFFTAFYGFIRPGEFTTVSQSFDSSRDLTLSEVSYSPHLFTVFLKYSNTDSLGAGVTITLSRSYSKYCPFNFMVRYLKARPCYHKVSPLFILLNGFQWQKSGSEFILLQSWRDVFYLPNYIRHSFRIGATTSAADAGFQPHGLSCWADGLHWAFESYTRLDSKNILDAQQVISTIFKVNILQFTGGGTIYLWFSISLWGFGVSKP